MTTLVFPRAMPASGVGQQSFEVDVADYMTRSGAGVLTSIQAGFPLWAATWTLANVINPRTSDAWRGFLTALGGSKRRFWGYDVE
ncbi:MAG: hypothetical protein JSS35_09220, partial [Proteobacteria bacterium]|nr:hypothetical protein [Pseudomonadota bacterium]